MILIKDIFSALATMMLLSAACVNAQTKTDSSGEIVLLAAQYEDLGVYAEETGSVDSAAMLAAHNRWRSEAGVPDLTWSEVLAQSAQLWADHLAANGCRCLSHSQGSQGENIYKVSSVVWSDGHRDIQSKTPQQITDGWASEIKNYQPEDNSCSGICGHYTQIVWRDSKAVGCAVSTCPDMAQIWVCHYNPPGNVKGKRPY